MSKDKISSKLWGGRFSENTAKTFERFSSSIGFDKRLYQQDIDGSLAHLAGLAKAEVITADEHKTLSEGLEKIRAMIENGTFEWQEALEDVHTNIEQKLVELVGEVGKKLHTGRSRNDQIATDMRLYARGYVDALHRAIFGLQKNLVDIAEREADTAMPAFTHLQAAQPVSFGHHILAWFEMLRRDNQRLVDLRKRINILPLGSAAGTGTPYPIDRAYVAELLGFESVSNNSLDAVSDRDFAIELCFVCAVLMMHLSRICEEIVIWCSQPFGFVELPDRFCTGSSIMPQKKNPDAAELVRGKSGRVFGSLMALLTLMKAQPLAYNRDNQEDKESMFDALDTTIACVQIMNDMLTAMTVNHSPLQEALAKGFTTATDLADHLVGRGVPFRDAHRIVGEVVQMAIKNEQTLEELSEEQTQTLHPALDKEALETLSVEYSLQSKAIYGGTAPEQVRKQIQLARNYLADHS